MIVGCAIIISLRSGNSFHATAGCGIKRIDPKHRFVISLRGVEFPEIVIALGHVQPTADGIDVLGMLVGQRRVGANRVIKVTEFLFRGKVIWIDIRSKHALKEGAGLFILAHLAELLGEGDARIAEMLGVTDAALSERQSVRKDG